MAQRLSPSGLRSKVASSSSTSTSTTSTTSSAVPRALISGERVPKSNTGKYKESGNSDPKNKSPRDRIEEFPGENLYICVFAMVKTVRLEGGLYECSLKSKLIELSY